MSAIFTRSALVHWGHNPAPDVACVVIDPRHGRKVVTWAEVMRDRRERQAGILARKRHVEPWRACRLWVAYFDQTFYGGWHTFLTTLEGEQWIRHGPTQRVMDLFPMGLLPLGNDRDQREAWMKAFARRYRTGTHHGKPTGSAYLWKRRDELRR